MDGFSLLLILKANNTPKIKFVTQPGFELLRLTVASRSMTPLVRLFAVKANQSRTSIEFSARTPQEFRHIAQRCPRNGLPWVRMSDT